MIAILYLVSLSGCGYGVRYLVSSAVYQGGQEFNETPDARGLDYVAVEFKNSDGDLLHGWLIPGRDHYPLILYCHGNMANVTHGLETIEVLNRLGFSLFAFEYRGYGRSEGRPLFEDDFYRDARSALWWLQKTGWDSRRMIYYGHSLGAAVALNLALEEPPAGVVLESAFTSYAGMVKYKAPLIYILGGWSTREFNNLAKIQMLKSPVVLLHGTSDVVVPPQMSQQLYDAANSPKRLYLIESAGHSDVMDFAREGIADRLGWFVVPAEADGS